MPESKFTIINIGTLSMNKFWGETERLRSATATCTLLVVAGQRLIVDPSPAPALLEPMLLARTGLHPADIDAVFITHFHGDHRFGLELFPDVPWFMASAGLQEWAERSPHEEATFGRFLTAEDNLPGGIRLLPTPGHTMGHYALMADTRWGCLVVAGDAVMTRDFYRAEEGFHNSVDFGQAADTIREIRRVADVLIPGHDNWLLAKGQPANS
jgi:glyoxylase-like metal-dependent hydrolase (beta-lactamase superfamily II)